MALTLNHPTLKEQGVQGYTTSIGGTPVATYIRVPFRARISKLSATCYGAITTADCVVTVAVNGTTNTALAGTIAVASAAAGQVVSWIPTSAVYVSEDDYVTITPSAASGSSIGAMFRVDFQVA